MAGKLLSISAWLVSLAVVASSGWAEDGSSGGIELVDATGFEFRAARPPERLVSLNPDLTENVIALGAGERLVGVSDFCPRPAPDSARRLGGLRNPGLERIVALLPDLVLATREGNSPETVSRLRSLGLPVLVFAESNLFSDYFSFLRGLGSVLGREEAAAGLTGELETLIEEVRSRVSAGSPPGVLIQIGVSPLITATRETLIGEMIEIAGGRNIAAGLSPRYPVISRERVLAEDPEVIVVAAMGSEAEEAMTFWRRFPELRAVGNGRVFLLDPDTVCRLGPRLGEGLELLSLFITGHPVRGESE